MAPEAARHLLPGGVVRSRGRDPQLADRSGRPGRRPPGRRLPPHRPQPHDGHRLPVRRLHRRPLRVPRPPRAGRRPRRHPVPAPDPGPAHRAHDHAAHRARPGRRPRPGPAEPRPAEPRPAEPGPLTPAMDHASAQGWAGLTGLVRTFLRPYAGRAGLVVALLVIQAAGNLFLPLLNADIINRGVVEGDVGYIWRTGGIMLGIVFALGVVAVVTTYHASRVSMGFGASLRAAIYRRVQAFSGREMNGFGIPSLITRNLHDIEQVELFLQMALTQLVIAVIMSIGGLVLAVRESPALSLLLLVTIPAMALVIGVTLAMSLPMFRSIQVKVDRI